MMVLALSVARSAAAAAPDADAPALVSTLPGAPPPATPDARGPIAGALTVVVPFMVGCALWADDDHIAVQKAGTVVMLSGFAFAPWVAEGVGGRWRRAAVYGSISAATAAATAVYMEYYKDPFQPGYRNIERVPFGMLLTSALFAAAAGVADSFVVGPAPRDAR
jgi:hypothetical protein